MAFKMAGWSAFKNDGKKFKKTGKVTKTLSQEDKDAVNLHEYNLEHFSEEYSDSFYDERKTKVDSIKKANPGKFIKRSLKKKK